MYYLKLHALFFGQSQCLLFNEHPVNAFNLLKKNSKSISDIPPMAPKLPLSWQSSSAFFHPSAQLTNK